MQQQQAGILMQRSRYLWRLFCALAVAWGVATGPVPAADGTTRQEQIEFRAADEAQVPERFRLPAHQFPAEIQLRGEYDDFVVSNVRFPSPVVTPFPENNTVHCEFFQPQGDGPYPAIVMLHILGGDFELSRVCCRVMAQEGVAALFVKMPYYGPRRPHGQRVRMISEDDQQTRQAMTQAVVDIRRGVAWLAQREAVDQKRLGIAGISLGGIVAALATEAEPQLRRGCFVLAGGDMARIVMESDETADIRAKWEHRTVTPQQVTEMLSPIDPLTYADRLRGREILMMNARHDEVVPPACTELLWKAAGEPEIVWWNAGHYSAALQLPGGLARMVRFFAAPLATGGPPTANPLAPTGESGSHGAPSKTPRKATQGNPKAKRQPKKRQPKTHSW